MSADGSRGTQPTALRSRPAVRSRSEGPLDLDAQPKFNILKIQFKHVRGWPSAASQKANPKAVLTSLDYLQSSDVRTA